MDNVDNVDNRYEKLKKGAIVNAKIASVIIIIDSIIELLELIKNIFTE